MTTYSKPTRRKNKKTGKLSKNYLVRVNHHGRRSWLSTGCTTLEGARAVVKEWEIREARGERRLEDCTLHQLFDRWLEAKRSRISHSCMLVYESHVRTWKDRKRGIADKPLQALDGGDFERYLTRRRQFEERAPRTLNNERAILRSIFNFARRSNLVDRNPLDGVEKFREERRAVRVPTEDEEERLLEQCRHSNEATYGFVLCLLESGLRRGTVTQLEWDDVDFERGEWRIPAAKMKSREDFNGRPVAPRLLQYLRRLRRPAGTIFEKLSPQRFATAARRAGVKWLKPHDLRRAFVSRCRRKGLPLEVCMYLSDHRDVDTVMRSYRAIGEHEVSDATRKLWSS